MRKILSLLFVLFAVINVFAENKSEAFTFNTETGFAEVTIKTAGAADTGADYEFSKGDITVTGAKGYIYNKKHSVYKGGSMVIDAGSGAKITKVALTYASKCFPFAEAVAGGSTAEKTTAITDTEYEPTEAAQTVTFTNVSTGKTEVKKMTVYYQTEEGPAKTTLTVDDASKVRVMDTSYQYLTLVDGTQEIAPGDYRISSSDYTYTINKVLQNDVEVAYNYGYTVTVAAGDSVEIKALYDAATYKMKVSGEAVKSVRIAGSDVADFSEFDAAAGYTATIELNTTEYKIDGVTVNGEAVSYNGANSIDVVVKGETTVEVAAHKYAKVSVKVNVEDPSTIVLYSGYQYYYNSTPLTLDAEGKVEISENEGYLWIKKADDCFITSVKSGETTYTANYEGNYAIKVSDGMEITVESGKIVKDQKATVVVKDLALANYNFYMQNSSRATITLVEGKNEIEFAAQDAPFLLGAYGSDLTKMVVYINGAKVSPTYEGGTNYELNITNEALVEIYLGGGETTYSGSSQPTTPTTAKLIVDDASKVRVMDTSYQYLTLVDGAQEIAPGDYRISSSDYTYTINKVLKNDVEVAFNYGYTVTVAEGDKIEIKALYDAATYKMKVSGEAVKSVRIAGSDVADFSEFDAAAGYTATIELNTTEYKIDGVTVNGEAISYNGANSIDVVVKGETTVEVAAHKYAKVAVKVNVEDPSTIVLYSGYQYYYNSTPLTLDAEGKVEISENEGYLWIKKADDCFITSVKSGETAYTANYEGNYAIKVSDGMEITVESGKIVKDQKATVVVKDLALANYNFYMQNSSRATITLVEGKNEIEFAAQDAPFLLGAYGSDLTKMVVYINGAKVSPTYEGGTNYELNIANGNYVEIFLGGGESEYETVVGINNASLSTKKNGKYLVNGKIVIVKNGKTYNTAGQIE